MNNAMLPSVLQTNAVDENQSSRVESIIQEADNHSWIKSGDKFAYGKSKFVLAKKGSALSPTGSLIFKVEWSAYDDGQDRFCSLNRFSGGAYLLNNVRLYMGGKLISETRNVGQKIAIENLFVPYDAQVEILDQKLNGNHQYFYAENGDLTLANDVDKSSIGFRSPSANEGATIECAVNLDQLFPVLKDTMLPSTLKGEIIVEIDWVGNWDEIMTESGAVAFTDTQRNFRVLRPRMHLDYITFADEVSNALSEQVNSANGMTIPYRQQVLTNHQLPAIVGDDTSQPNDIELGFAGRSVMKIYIQKLLQGKADALLRNTRSDGFLQEELQVVVNNRNLYDREVKKVSELYSYLTQTASKPAYILSGSYNQVGALTPATANILSDNVVLPQDTGLVANTTGVQGDLQGRLRYLGVNLANVRGDNDTPQNAIMVGQSPMVLRLTRNSGSGGTDENALNNSAESKSACNLNVWVECVKALVIRNGVIDTIDL